MKKYLLIIKSMFEYGDDDKHPCGLCKKPVSVLYEIQLEEGGILTVCRSDLHRVLSMKAQTQEAVAQAEPLFAGSNDRVR